MDSFANFDLAMAVPAPFVRRAGDAPASQVILPETCRELDVYALLAWRFDRPMGVMSFLGPEGGDPDGPFKWDFSFATPDGLLVSVLRTWRHLEFQFIGREITLADAQAFVSFNLERYGNLVAAVREGLECHRLVVNPFYRHRQMADYALKQLQTITVPEIWFPGGMGKSRADLDKQTASLKAHMDAAHREVFYSVTLVAESAYQAESFINLVLALTMKPLIREDKTLFKDTLHKQWRPKLQNLPLTSFAVTRSPRLDDPRVATAQKLFDLRNRIAHSYPDTQQLATGRHVYFQEAYPILEYAEPFLGFQVGTERVLPTRDDAIEAKRAADAFVEFVVEQLDESYRAEIDLAARCNPLGYNVGSGRYSIPFGPTLMLLLGQQRKKTAPQKPGGRLKKSGPRAKNVVKRRKS